MSTTYRVQVLTKTFVPKLNQEYVDAQYIDVPVTMTLGEVKTVYESQIIAEEAKRIQTRIDEQENQLTPVEPTKAEYEAQKLELLKQVAEIDVKISSIQPTPPKGK